MVRAKRQEKVLYNTQNVPEAVVFEGEEERRFEE